MIKIVNPDKNSWEQVLQRPTATFQDIESKVRTVFNEIQAGGDKAVVKYTSLFDGADLTNYQVTELEINEATDAVSADLKQAIVLAKSNIAKFHAAQKTDRIEVETSIGVHCWQEKRAIQKVGLYIPGGNAPLFSTVLMLAVPAQLAGCTEIVLCSPPNKEGKINPAILFAAQLCGVTKIFKVGGIQAIAAMTFGTATVPKVYKIFGPGNQYVTVAKQVASQFGVAIDMPAGPSELLVFADDAGNAAFIASDLLSQAEHGVDSQTIFVSTSKTLIDAVEIEVYEQLKNLPTKEIAAQSIANSKLILVENDAIALELINEYAPEHFIVCAQNEAFFVDNIQNAGSTFIGNFSPESAGDYASGTNHTLPTNGFCKNYSGVNLDSFVKIMSFQKISEQGIQNIGKAVETMADAEGLFAHKNAVTLRLQSLKNK